MEQSNNKFCHQCLDVQHNQLKSKLEILKYRFSFKSLCVKFYYTGLNWVCHCVWLSVFEFLLAFYFEQFVLLLSNVLDLIWVYVRKHKTQNYAGSYPIDLVRYDYAFGCSPCGQYSSYNPYVRLNEYILLRDSDLAQPH